MGREDGVQAELGSTLLSRRQGEQSIRVELRRRLPFYQTDASGPGIRRRHRGGS